VEKPVLATPAVLVRGRLSGPRIPIWPLPAGRFAEAGARGGEPIVKHAFLHPARRSGLPERPVVLIADAERLDDAILEIPVVVLPGMRTAQIDGPHVHRRAAFLDPMSHHVSDAPAGQNAERIEARRDEEIL